MSDALTTESAIARCGLPGPHVPVRLDVKVNDLLTANRYFAEKRMWMSFGLTQIILIMILIMGALFGLQQENLSPMQVLMTCGVGYLAVTLLHPLYLNWRRRLDEDDLRARFLDSEKKGSPAAYFVLSPEGYAVVGPEKSEYWRWPAVKEVISLPELLILRNDRDEAHFVAQHLFGSEEKFVEFVSLLQGYYNKDQPPPPASPEE